MFFLKILLFLICIKISFNFFNDSSQIFYVT